MKKAICVMLCLVLTCLMPTVCAADGAREWVFRNGVTWNSTIEDVMTGENGEIEAAKLEALSVLLCEDVSVSKYSGDLMYLFCEDALLGAGYSVYSAAEEDVGYLKGALLSKYGPAFCGDMEYVRCLLMRPIEDKTGLEMEKANEAVKEEVQGMWRLEDGTLICFISLPIFDGYTMKLIYLNEAYLLEAYPIYNVDGL